MNTKRKTTTTPKQATKIIKKNTKTKTKASCARTHDAHRRARVFTTKHETEDIKGLLPEHGTEVQGTQQEHESTTKAQTVHGVEEHGYEEEAVDVGGRPSYLCDPAVELASLRSTNGLSLPRLTKETVKMQSPRIT